VVAYLEDDVYGYNPLTVKSTLLSQTSNCHTPELLTFSQHYKHYSGGLFKLMLMIH
jgi:hypothetical protein